MQQLELWDLLPQVENGSQDIKPLLFPNPRKAHKLRELADSMTKAIAVKKNSPIAQLNPTRRRARIANSLYQEGLRLEQIQFLLYALANRAEQGNLPRIKRRNHRQNPTRSLASMSKDSWSDKDIEDVFASDGWYKEWVKKLKSAGIRTPQQCKCAICASLRQRQGRTQQRFAIAALKQLGAERPKSTEKTEALEISQLKREAVWQKIPDYFPTPQHLLERMMQLAELEPGMRVLEPNAGSGSICLEVRAAGIEPDCFEVSHPLREILTRQGFNLIGEDFIEVTPKPIYQRVIMNPPFSLGNDIYHVQQAFKWLVPSGRLVSIVSNSYTFGSKQKYQHFCSWLRCLGAAEFDNPAGSFLQSDRRTNVNTRMLVIDKPTHE